MSRLIRRLHMYLALGLIPWVIIYAVSTLVINHRDYFDKNTIDEARAPSIRLDREYHPNFPVNADLDAKVQQILKDLDMEGGYYVDHHSQSEDLVIYRESPGRERVIKYFPGESKLVVEESDFRFRSFITDLHLKHGFANSYMASNVWAVLVDLLSVAMIIWVASGIYMWLELRKTRLWGALSLGAGIVLFAAVLMAL